MKLLSRLKLPISEPQLALTLAISLVMMAVMLVCLLWQANVIDFQRELIRELWTAKYPG